MKKNHQFHLVDLSPWPLIIALNLLSVTLASSFMFSSKTSIPMFFNIIILSSTALLWWRDIHRESTFQGNHTLMVVFMMKYGMMLFILSEILLFFSFFWSFFHHSLSPNQEIGLLWPPKAILTFNPLHIPLLNTIILLSSGISITWTHVSLCLNNNENTKKSLLITILLGLMFSFFQMFEYSEASFSMSDSVYGSSFFLTTGFHGLHVIIGTLFLIHSFCRMNSLHFSKNHHIGMEMSIWYWHFVDVVWLFVYSFMYWWGI